MLVIARGLRELLTSRELCDVALVAAGGRKHRNGKTGQANSQRCAFRLNGLGRWAGFPSSPHRPQPQSVAVLSSVHAASEHLGVSLVALQAL